MQSTCVALMGFEGKRIGRAKVKVRVGKLKNGKAAVKDEITGEIKGGGYRLVVWIWKLYNMTFKTGVVLENWRC